ncbi:hypothetical protein FCV25MIE_08132 [Fagus crenata]
MSTTLITLESTATGLLQLRQCHFFHNIVRKEDENYDFLGCCRVGNGGLRFGNGYCDFLWGFGSGGSVDCGFGLVMGTVIVMAMIMVVLEPQCLVGVAGKEYLVSKILSSWGYFLN